jgi:hypothetical protein
MLDGFEFFPFMKMDPQKKFSAARPGNWGMALARQCARGARAARFARFISLWNYL